MEIVTTREELAAALGTTQFGYVSVARKVSSLTLHEGHAHVVNHSKANYEKTVIGFWHGLELLYSLYGIDYFGENDGSEWDEQGCKDWAESLGADYVMIPAVGYSDTYLTQLGIQGGGTDPVVHSWVNQVWANNNYPDFPANLVDNSRYNNTLRAKAFVIAQHYKNQLNQVCVASWKDGPPLFIMQHYVNNYTTESFDLIDPIRDADGLYYSSTYLFLTPEEKNIIKQFETIVDTIGWEDENNIKSAIMSAYPNDVIVSRVDITEGGIVGENNDFILISYSINGKGDTYPIYKKGVR